MSHYNRVNFEPVCSVSCFLYWFTDRHSPGNISSRFPLSTNLPYGHSAIFRSGEEKRGKPLEGGGRDRESCHNLRLIPPSPWARAFPLTKIVIFFPYPTIWWLYIHIFWIGVGHWSSFCIFTGNPIADREVMPMRTIYAPVQSRTKRRKMVQPINSIIQHEQMCAITPGERNCGFQSFRARLNCTLTCTGTLLVQIGAGLKHSQLKFVGFHSYSFAKILFDGPLPNTW